MTNEAIVSKVKSIPQLEGFSDNNPVPEKVRLKPGEPLHFSLNAIIEPVGKFSKRAYISSPVPGGACFEIYCDEGKSIGGEESAPAPLSYFVASVGFCLMTHISGFLSFTSLKVRSIKLELRGNFMTTLGHIKTGGQGEGGCDGFETNVIIDSDEPPEKIAELIEVCERACIASQTIAQAVPTSVNVLVNGKKV